MYLRKLYEANIIVKELQSGFAEGTNCPTLVPPQLALLEVEI